jgi:hypothetical protein
MRRLLLALIASAALGGCGGSEEASQPAPKVRIGNPFQDQLVAMSPTMRNIALIRAIHDGGGRCKGMLETRQAGEYKGLPMWAVRCRDGGDWALFVAANADVQLRRCDDLAQLGLPACGLGEKAARPPPPRAR